MLEQRTQEVEPVRMKLPSYPKRRQLQTRGRTTTSATGIETDFTSD